MQSIGVVNVINKRLVTRKGQNTELQIKHEDKWKINNYINKQETKGSNNCVGEYKNVCEIEKKIFVVALIGMS